MPRHATGYDAMQRLEVRIAAGELEPTVIRKDIERPTRASDYWRDVGMYGMGVGTALAAGAFGAVWMVSEYYQVFALDAAFAAALAAWGLGFTLVSWAQFADFNDRLWASEKEEAQFATSGPVSRPYVATSRSTYALVPEPDNYPGAAQTFAQAVLEGKAELTEKGARRYGYSRDSWTELRDWLIAHGVATWKDEKNRRLGIEVTGSGSERALMHIADGDYL